MNDPESKKSYFNLHVTGTGYVNRIREITPRKGDPFLCCTIAALVGESGSVEYRYFDVKVAGQDAQHLIRRCQDAVNEERKVLIGFRLGDLWIDHYTITKGEKAGQQGTSLKARLLFISWINVAGTTVYKAESKPAADDADDQAPGAVPPAADSEGPSPEGLSTDSKASAEEAQAAAA